MQRKSVLGVLLLIALLASTGCSLFDTPVPKVPLDPNIVFQEDFKGYALGEAPETWGQWHPGSAAIEVIQDAALKSGRALKIADIPTDTRYTVVVSPTWDSSDGNTLMIEYKLKWVSGTGGLIIYVNGADDTAHMNTPMDHGQLRWYAPGDERTIGQLESGWNHVRIVARLDEQKADVYFNNMETPAVVNAGFRNPVDAWEGFRFLLRLDTHAEQTREVHFGEFLVKKVEETGGK